MRWWPRPERQIWGCAKQGGGVEIAIDEEAQVSIPADDQAMDATHGHGLFSEKPLEDACAYLVGGLEPVNRQ